MTEHKKLTAEELGATRYLVNRGVYIAQGDQIRLFDHIDALEAELAEARREKLRAEKVAAMANAWPEEIKGAEDLLKNIPQQLAIEMPKDAIWLAVCDYLAEAEMEGNDG